MLKKLLSISLVVFFLVPSMLVAQYNATVSTGVAPWAPQGKYEEPNSNPLNLNTRGFSYQSTSLTASTLFKYYVGTAGAGTTVGTVQPNFFGNGDFANPTGAWKFYVMEQVAAPFNIYEVDTTTGAITLIGPISGLTSGHSPIMFEWDHTSNQFYVYSSNSTVSSGQLYSMNWATRVCTPIGPANTTCPAAIAGGFNAFGTLFAFDLVNDNIWKINKGTGIATVVGPSGYTGNYGQDAGFDRSDWGFYWAACGGVVGLRSIDTTTGATVQIAPFPYTQVLATGFAAFPGPSIMHTPLPSTENTAGPYVVNAQIIPQGSPINPAYTKLHWSRNSTTITDSVSMTNTGGNNWTANIPGNSTAATYRYYIRAYDNLGRVVTSPPGAPANLHLFLAGPDTQRPVITHTQIGDVPITTWPPTVTANVVDPSDYGGLDSVWVRWYKNATTNGIIHLKLNNTSGSTYAAAFNQPPSYVAVGDSIFYKIFARDNSSNHNVDSTILYKFKLVNIATACIGTGTTAAAWPFNTFWHDSRTQFLYTPAEITAGGGAAGNIFQVGFTVVSAATQSMSGFNIRMQNTTLTSIAAFVSTGWTTVYTGTYTVPGTGLQYITLQNGFNWNGTDNLLMEICFDNTSYTSATSVNSTAAAGMCREYHTDGSTGCTMTGGTLVNRPNTCFKITLPVGIPNVNLELPKEFAISQNYPNPFNPTTSINYYIPKASDVSITVYDITGKVVATLINEFKQAGSYNVNFDASTLASGMYLYRIQAGDFTATKKMVLVK